MQKIIRTRPPTRRATKQCYVDPRLYLLCATCLSKDVSAVSQIQKGNPQIEEMITQASQDETASIA
jgi:hypothetical protein